MALRLQFDENFGDSGEYWVGMRTDMPPPAEPWDSVRYNNFHGKSHYLNSAHSLSPFHFASLIPIHQCLETWFGPPSIYNVYHSAR